MEKLKTILEKWLLQEGVITSIEIKEHITPGHGCCCTCQKCGYCYDDCVCVNNDILKALDQLVRDISDMYIKEGMFNQDELIQEGYDRAIKEVVFVAEQQK